VARQVERIAQRLTGIAAFDDWGKIENGEWNHEMRIAPDAADGKLLASAGRGEAAAMTVLDRVGRALSGRPSA
ncbi:MAG TPA: hypothetical protein VJX94_31860, partial [Stellaceae bacterium]|nr:hypothetical protein [Stellaceae bacterium]